MVKYKTQQLRVPDHIADLIRGSHPQIKRKLKAALQIVLNDPHEGKSLKAELEELKSFRVGRMRIIYRVAKDGIVEVVAIGPRKTIYEETYRLLKKKLPKIIRSI